MEGSVTPKNANKFTNPSKIENKRNGKFGYIFGAVGQELINWKQTCFENIIYDNS